MSHLLAVSFDCVSSPFIFPKAEQKKKDGSVKKDYGWGLAWYPNNDQSMALIKDVTAVSENTLAPSLEHWERFRSQTFMCHLLNASKGTELKDTQPFSRTYAGRDWLWMQSEDKKTEELSKKIGFNEGIFEPVGNTGSEMAFCYIMRQVRQYKARTLSDIPWETLQQWFKDLDSLSSTDFVISDGQILVAYKSQNPCQPLYLIRRLPPHKNFFLESEHFVFDVSGPLEESRTMTLVCTEPISDEVWGIMNPGQMVAIRAGSVIWNSHYQGRDNLPSGDEQEKINQHSEEAAKDICPLILPNLRKVQQQEYSIFHETVYSYEEPVEYSTHYLRLDPVQDSHQEVLEHRLEVSVEGEPIAYEDVFGNYARYLTLSTPYKELRIVSESKVRLKAQDEDDYSSKLRKPLMPLVWMPWQSQMMMPYLLPFELPESQLMELSEFAMSFVERNDYALIDTLRDLNLTLYRDFAYVSGSTSILSTPYDVYVSRRGVCQDFANLMICLCRLLNIPARYRVGYIYTGANYENKIQSEASHAWVEVYLPYLGWRGFDPTNACLCNHDHIKVACGRSYLDATPTSGTLYKGGAGERLTAQVKVEHLS